MNVAFQIDQLWFRAPGGIGTYVKALMTALPAADPGLDLMPFHARWGMQGPSEMPLAHGGIGVGLPLSIRWLYPSWSLLGAPHLPRSLADADVVHATNHAAIPPVRRGQRLVVTVHDLTFERYPQLFSKRWLWLYRRGLQRAAERADAILVPSRSVADDIAARTSVDAERMHVIPLASSLRRDHDPESVAIEREALADQDIEPPYILAVGTIEPRKNLVRLVLAYRRLASEGFPHALVLMGPSGWGTDEVSQEIARGGPGRVLRTGGVAHRALTIAYADASAVAYVSLSEGFGLPVVEAMSMGVPTITSNTSSMPEVAGDAALLVDPTDVDAITDALRRVLTDEALAADLRRRGPLQAARFSWEATARATLEVYREVAGRTEGAT